MPYPLRPRVLLLAALWATLFLFWVAASASAAPRLRFTVGMPQPTTHLFTIEMTASGLPASAQTVELALPVWTPGSYLVREFERNVQDFAPLGDGGKSLAWQKTRKNVWQVATGGATQITVRYRVYANALAVQQAELTDTGAFWNNAALLMHLRGTVKTPVLVRVSLPQGWTIATGLPQTADGYRAPDMDVLYDSPFLCGPLDIVDFTALGKPHRLALWGRGNYDKAFLARYVQTVVETEGRMMGGLPYDNYTFLLLLRDGGGGGLEHLNSTAIVLSPYSFRDPLRFTDNLEVIAHEYFHLWNVKRIRPDALGPFDYENENYTRSLWVAEGITSYYEDVFLRRAGILTRAGYLDNQARSIANVEQTPGRLQQSVEEASFDAWIKQYRPDENSVNTQISYYTKGALLGMLLDLTLRQKTANARSLDDVMRSLYREYAQKGRNYTPSDFQKVCEQVAGGTLEAFFASYVRGRDDLDFRAALAPFGLTLTRTARTAGGQEAAPTAYLGARYAVSALTSSTPGADRTVATVDPAGVKVSAVPSDTPAYAQGLSAGDVLLAVDGVRVRTADDVNSRLADHRPGDKVTLTLFRLDQLRQIDVTLGSRVRPDYRLTVAPNATDAQKALLKGWLGE